MSSNTRTSTFATIAATSLAGVVGGAGPLPAKGQYQYEWTRRTLGYTPSQYDQFNTRLSTFPPHIAGRAIGQGISDGLHKPPVPPRR